MATLSDALRKAALDRAQDQGKVVDDYILEPDGVIDLRRLEAESQSTVPRTVPMLPMLGLTEADLDLPDVAALPKTLWRRSIVHKSTSTD